MSRISRKEMKTDELALEVSKTVEFVQSHRQNLILWGIIAAVLLAAGGGGYLFYSKRIDTANEMLGNAIRTFHSPIRPISLNDQGDEPTFPTIQARDEQALRDFQTVAADYSMLRPGKVARYYVGLTQLDQSHLAEADKELTAAMSSGDPYVGSLARLALASVYVREKKTAEAEQAYRYLVDHPSDSVPKVTAQLALAAFLGPDKPAEAEKIYKDIESSKPAPEIAELVSKARQDAAK